MSINPDAMCKQVRGEREVLYRSEHGKSCSTEILEVIASINVEVDLSGNPCTCGQFIG